MKRSNLIIKTISLLCVIAFASQAQIPSKTPNERNSSKPQEVEQGEARINLIISKSEQYFKQGEFNIKDHY